MNKRLRPRCSAHKHPITGRHFALRRQSTSTPPRHTPTIRHLPASHTLTSCWIETVLCPEWHRILQTIVHKLVSRSFLSFSISTAALPFPLFLLVHLLQLSSYSLVQALCKVPDIMRVQTSHRNTSISRQIDMRLLCQRLARLRADPSETVPTKKTSVSNFDLHPENSPEQEEQKENCLLGQRFAPA